MGKVLLPGPEVKLEITRSSHDRVKASSHPDRMAGKMIGRGVTKKPLPGRAHKPPAPSSAPGWKPGGPPMSCSRAKNSSSNDNPVIPSGITKGAVVIAFKVNLPRNWRKRANPKPASVPKITEPEALITATFNEIHAASRISSLFSSE